jgi:hypothetical protein
MKLPIYVINDSPSYDHLYVNATLPVVTWTSVCHIKPFIAVHHMTRRWTSRYNSVENKRPFQVIYHGMWTKLGASATLEGAEKIARAMAKDLK